MFLGLYTEWICPTHRSLVIVHNMNYSAYLLDYGLWQASKCKTNSCPDQRKFSSIYIINMEVLHPSIWLRSIELTDLTNSYSFQFLDEELDCKTCFILLSINAMWLSIYFFYLIFTDYLNAGQLLLEYVK